MSWIKVQPEPIRIPGTDIPFTLESRALGYVRLRLQNVPDPAACWPRLVRVTQALAVHPGVYDVHWNSTTGLLTAHFDTRLRFGAILGDLRSMYRWRSRARSLRGLASVPRGTGPSSSLLAVARAGGVAGSADRLEAAGATGHTVPSPSPRRRRAPSLRSRLAGSRAKARKEGRPIPIRLEEWRR